MALFSSDYENLMFVPFINIFINGSNPYEYYYVNELLPSFPYPPLMLIIMSFGSYIIHLFNITNIIISNLIFKLPLLFFDILCFIYLLKLKVNFKYAFILYFLSPIVIYSTFIHSQLDIIPTTFLIICFYYLVNFKINHNLFLSSIFLGLAISCKFHIFATLPLIFLYIISKKKFIDAVLYTFTSFIALLIFIIPFMGYGLINSLLFNKEQGQLFNIFIDYGSTKVILPILLLMIVYIKCFDIKYFNKTILFSLNSIIFSLFLISITPMPAWFIWIVPFIVLYFSNVQNDKYKFLFIYGAFNLLYITYFIFFHKTEFVDIYFLDISFQNVKIDNEILRAFVFTIMTSTLICIIYKMYVIGLLDNSIYKRASTPFTIGITGDSGTGKSKMIEKINNLFEKNKDILFIEGDGDHRFERNDKMWENITALNPKANYLYKQAKDINNLRNGNSVYRVDYDHDTGRFTKVHKLLPRKYIILSSLHALYLPQLRKEIDLKIYMDTDDELRKYWKIRRDTVIRGYSKTKVIEQIEKRYEDAKKFIYPQKKYADVVFSLFDRTLTSCMEDEHKEILSLKLETDISYDFEPLIENFKNYNINVSQNEINEKQVLIFDGAEFIDNQINFENIAENIIIEYDDLFIYKKTWQQGIEGAIQLIILYIISIKMRGDYD